MKATIRVEGTEVFLKMENGEETRLQAKENLELARTKLLTLNGLRLSNGSPIYQSCLYEGKYSIWSFFQETIFWNELRHYARFEEVIRHIYNSKNIITKIFVDNNDLAQLLKSISKIEVVSKKNNFIKRIGHFFLRFVGCIVSYAAILKLCYSKTPTLIYTPDKVSSNLFCDFRLGSLYSYLHNYKKNYLELIHTNLGIDFLKNLWKRKRLAIYLECIAPRRFLGSLDLSKINWPQLPEHEKRFYERLLGKIDVLGANSKVLIDRLHYILKHSQVKRLVALDDMRCTNELIVACKKQGITTNGLQHGQFSKYHVGWMNYGIAENYSVTFDTLWLWNSFWQKILCSYSNKYDLNNTAIGGKEISVSKTPAVTKTKNYNQESLNILLPYETSISFNEVGPFIKKFVEFGFTIYFSLRPDRSPDFQLKEYKLEPSKQVIVVRKIDPELLSKIDAVVGVHSTLLSDLVLYDIPIFQIPGDFDLGHILRDNNISAPLYPEITRESILSLVANHESKKEIICPPAPLIEETYNKIFN